VGAIPKRVADRLVAGLKRFQLIIRSARARDVNESDTVVIVTDALSELLGYDKYSEITTEHSIRGTYCDLAITLESKVRFIIEVKAIGLDLKDQHVKQAVDYAANLGVEWVILTNGMIWRVIHVTFAKPIGRETVLEVDILSLNPRNTADVACIYLLTREALLKSALIDYQTQRQATNRFLLGALLLTEPVLQVVRRELRRLSPDVKVRIPEIEETLRQEVLKREVVEGENAAEARKEVAKAAKRTRRSKRADSSAAGPTTPEADTTTDAPEQPKGPQC
jgi:exopolyphosphatase/pppGpp-phosphohydrolase